MEARTAEMKPSPGLPCLKRSCGKSIHSRRASQFSAELLENTARRYERRVQTLQSNLEPTAFSPLFDEDQALRRLTRTLLEAERKELASLRRKAIIHDEVFFQLSRELDIEETRLLGQRI